MPNMPPKKAPAKKKKAAAKKAPAKKAAAKKKGPAKSKLYQVITVSSADPKVKVVYSLKRMTSAIEAARDVAKKTDFPTRVIFLTQNQNLRTKTSRWGAYQIGLKKVTRKDQQGKKVTRMARAVRPIRVQMKLRSVYPDGQHYGAEKFIDRARYWLRNKMTPSEHVPKKKKGGAGAGAPDFDVQTGGGFEMPFQQDDPRMAGGGSMSAYDEADYSNDSYDPYSRAAGYASYDPYARSAGYGAYDPYARAAGYGAYNPYARSAGGYEPQPEQAYAYSPYQY